MILRFATCIGVLVFAFNPFLSDAKAPPEMKVLGRLIGEWDGTDQDRSVTFDVTTTWILNGQLVQQKQVFQDGAESLLQYGYDQQANNYFLNLHDSRGIHWMLRGDWDEQTQSFTFKGRSGEQAVTIKSTFRNKDVIDWTITLLSTTGDVTELRGTNQRVIK